MAGGQRSEQSIARNVAAGTLSVSITALLVTNGSLVAGLLGGCLGAILGWAAAQAELRWHYMEKLEDSSLWRHWMKRYAVVMCFAFAFGTATDENAWPWARIAVPPILTAAGVIGAYRLRRKPK
jgi:membrane protein YqaA with SNARE-associated domain